jgi:hypothetical protein
MVNPSREVFKSNQAVDFPTSQIVESQRNGTLLGKLNLNSDLACRWVRKNMKLVGLREQNLQSALHKFLRTQGRGRGFESILPSKT